MIIIKNVETENIKENTIRYQHYDPELIAATNYTDPCYRYELKVETIKGRRYRNSNGLDIVIGWSLAVQKALGLPFEELESLRSRCDYKSKRIEQLTKELRMIYNLSFWERIKFLINPNKRILR